jgi:transcription antitermination factor NusG
MSAKLPLWYAIYTKPRCEKKVFASLVLKGIEAYCPVQVVMKKWSDRYKAVEEPLFKSYVFLKIKEKEKTEVRLTDGVVNFVFWLGKPAIISEKDIITIKRFLKEYTDITVEKLELKENQLVKITRGILMDKKAIIKKVYKNKVIAELQTIGFRLVAEINKKDLMLIENN